MSEFVFALPVQGTSLNRPEVQSSSRTPEARVRPYRKACVPCHDRKVKCDKQSPCANCQKLQLDCVFPSPFRPSLRQPKGNTGEKSTESEAELLARIEKLEGAVEDLGALKNEVLRSRKRRKRANSRDSDDEDDLSYEEGELGRRDTEITSVIDQEVGKLIVDEGKSRYITGGFWASLDEDDRDLHVVLDRQAGVEVNDERSSFESGHHGFPFSPTNLNLYSLHPSPDQIRLLWEIFIKRIDPLAKILHKPTVTTIIKRITENPEALERLDKGKEALIFAIYFSAATSMTDEEMEEGLGSNKKTMMARYRQAAENTLMNANFLSTQEFVTLQAFLLYLACVRWSEDTRMVWTLTGLAIRIAQSLGLHRDGEHFPELSSFDKEMRRRVWWQLHYLNCAASDDQGSDGASACLNFDTKMPSNVNDSDLDPNTYQYSLEDRDGLSDMTFCLIRYEMMQTRRLIKGNRSIAEKENLLKACYERLETRYLVYCHHGGTLYWLAENIARMAMAKEWLLLYHDQSRLDRSRKLSREMKDRLFLTNLQIIERSIQLELDPRATEWRWLIPRSHQWLPMVFVLAELCVRSKCDVVDRAWRAVETSYSQRTGFQEWKSGNSAFLRKLMEKARAKRDADLSMESWNSLTNANIAPITQSSELEEDIGRSLRMEEPAVMPLTSPSSGPLSFPPTHDVHTDQPSSTLAPWSMNQSAFVSYMGVTDDAIYWNDWDRLVMDFQGGIDGQGQHTWDEALGGT